MMCKCVVIFMVDGLMLCPCDAVACLAVRHHVHMALVHVHFVRVADIMTVDLPAILVAVVLV